MKNNIRVNINGVIFNIDEDAHKELRSYLDRLKFHFGNGKSSEEIIFDIEARIAEMFIERNAENGVVDKAMVISVIKVMGEPNEILEEDEGDSYSQNYSTTSNGNIKRKLYRDPDNKIVGGVASGLSAYFDIDTVWIRLVFVVLTIFGMSIFLYIILWIVIPRANTTAQKLEMRGEEVTLENIRRTIKEEYDGLTDSFNNMADKHFRKKKGELTIFEKIAHVIVSVLSGIIKFIGAFIGIILAFVAIILLIAIVPAFVGGGALIFSLLPGISLFSLPELLNVFSTNPTEVQLFVNSLAIVIFIPLIALVYRGIKLLFGIKYRNKIISIALFIIWITGLTFLIFNLARYGNQFHKEAEYSNTLELKKFNSDTLYIEIKNNDTNIDFPILNSMNGQYLFCSTDSTYYMNPNISTSNDDYNEDFSIEINSVAFGKSYRRARRNAEKINYNYSQQDSLIILGAYCSFPREGIFKGQHLEININIPDGKTVKFIKPELENNFDFSKCIDENNSYIFIDSDEDRVIINRNGEDIEFWDDVIEINNRRNEF